MQIFEEIARKSHEQVIFCHDEASGLRAIIAIHDTTLGPALGGTRMYPYKSDEEALVDVLRLSRGMTYKSAAAGLNLGGGKAVIIGDPKKQKSEQLFRAYGRFVQGLAGRYITAEDVGTTVRDMEWVRHETDSVTGISRALGGSGDPSPMTALGVYEGMKAAQHFRTGDSALAGLRVSVQGVGAVGRHLVDFLVHDGAKVVVCDVDADNLASVTDKYAEVEVVAPAGIYDVPVDIYAPCAMGATLNAGSVARLSARIVCGVANNQLATPPDGAALRERGIVYAPDYVVNAGGMHNASADIFGRYDVADVWRRIRGIRATTLRILRQAEEEKRPTSEVAESMAREIVANVRREAAKPPAPAPAPAA